jgi:hypothetical protein
MITTIYRTAQGKHDERVRSMYGWFRVTALTDDGEHLVVGGIKDMQCVSRSIWG